MTRAEQTRKVDRHTTFACLSAPQGRLDGDHEDEILTAFKRKGWGVIAEENGYRFIHFDESLVANASSILDDLECDETGWSAYQLSFPTAEAAKATFDSAEWK